jgi:hypothetical protein
LEYFKPGQAADHIAAQAVKLDATVAVSLEMQARYGVTLSGPKGANGCSPLTFAAKVAGKATLVADRRLQSGLALTRCGG